MGDGVIAAVNNRDNASSEPYQERTRWTYKSRRIAIVKASADEGKIVIKADRENL